MRIRPLSRTVIFGHDMGSGGKPGLKLARCLDTALFVFSSYRCSLTTVNTTTATDADGPGEQGTARLDAEGGELSVKELDKRCYDLLECNARLCLRIQELGLGYSGLVREINDGERGGAAAPASGVTRHVRL